MYLDHFQVKEKPFQLNTDPRFLWLGRKHKEALTILQYGVQENKGLLLLTGEIGSGKTMLISALVSQLDNNKVLVARLPDPGLERREFFFLVARSFGIGRRVFSRESFTEAIDNFLSTLYSSGKKALLIVDEAQIMAPSILEEIRLLSNMEYRHNKLFNLFLVGQNEFNLFLLDPKYRSFRERITTTYNLELLSESETAAYLSHRLKVAGAQRPIFTDNAMTEIHLFSNGSPRQINIISDIALVYGLENNKTTIDREIIRVCKDRVRVPHVPGRPLPDEPLFVAENWQTPDVLKDKPDQVVFLSRIIKRMSWYSTLALMILLPCGYLLYSDRSRAYLSENIPFLKKVLPAPSLPYASRSSSLAPAPALQYSPNGKQNVRSLAPIGTSGVPESQIIPVAPARETVKKHPGTLSGPDAASIKHSETIDTARPAVQKSSGDSGIVKTGALPTKPKGTTTTSPRTLEKVPKIEKVTPNVRPVKPAAVSIAPRPVEPPRPAVNKTAVEKSSVKNPSVGLAGSEIPPPEAQSDTDLSPSETPDPRDIINWLLQEKEKSKVQNRP